MFVPAGRAQKECLRTFGRQIERHLAREIAENESTAALSRLAHCLDLGMSATAVSHDNLEDGTTLMRLNPHRLERVLSLDE